MNTSIPPKPQPENTTTDHRLADHRNPLPPTVIDRASGRGTYDVDVPLVTVAPRQDGR